MEKQTFEEKYSRLYIERGKKVSWNFAEAYKKIRTDGWRAERDWAEFQANKNKGMVLLSESLQKF